MLKKLKKHIIETEHDMPIRGEIYSPERLAEYAKFLAKELEITLETDNSKWLMPRVHENFGVLSDVYRTLTTKLRKKESIPLATQWLVENFHIIEDQIREIKEDLPIGFYKKLPKIKNGELKGYPRVYMLSLTLIAHLDSQLDKKTIEDFLISFQKKSYLQSSEIWAIPITLRIILIENLRRLILKTLYLDDCKKRMNNVARGLLKSEVKKETLISLLEDIEKKSPEIQNACIAQLCFNFRDQDFDLVDTNKMLEEYLIKKDCSINETITKNHLNQSETSITVGNIIDSFRLLSSIDWNDYFCNVSLVEKTLKKDPTDSYKTMDIVSKDRYRHVVEKISNKTIKDELLISNKVLQMALNAKALKKKNPREHHIGYYLIDDGLKELQNSLNYKLSIKEKYQCLIKKFPFFLYFSFLFFIIIALMLPYVFHITSLTSNALIIVFISMLILVPITDISLHLINIFFAKTIKPNVLPKIELKNGIPDSAKTFLVVPTIFYSKQEIDQILETLEIHHISNQDPNLYLALLSDFNDSVSEFNPQDSELLNYIKKKIQDLNNKYNNSTNNIFYLFHRGRKWNKSESIWMGEERKRGKLHDFNNFLINGETNKFTEAPDYTPLFRKIKYIITLDSDTKIPRGTAKQLIGTALHPLNKPVIHKGTNTVIKGYGIFQPRISISPSSSGLTLFSRIFSEYTGIDPYSTASSNIYQDMFDEGIYTGKGLYELATFEHIMKNRIPKNTVLSHDILEGIFLRTALVSDIELQDDYPSNYTTYSKRLHRWIRGDWQNIKWLFSSIPNKETKCEKTVLSNISRWKILDNLRRSINQTAILLSLIMGWILLPESSFIWTLSVMILIFIPPYIHAILEIFPKKRNFSWHEHIKEVLLDLKKGVTEISFLLIFLPFQAYNQIDAITRSLYRVFISKKNLLVWNCAASSETEFISKGNLVSKNNLIVEVCLFIFIYFYVRIDNPAWPLYFTFLVIWVLSPYVGLITGREIITKRLDLDFLQKQYLRKISRRTWSFFETFLTKHDNWLIPDNFQEIPKPMIAHRTSPTNIGGQLLSISSADDFGHISTKTMINLLEKSIESMNKLEKLNGHFFNWYDTKSLKPLSPIYISTVDSGNLAGHLLATNEKCLEVISSPVFNKNKLNGILDLLYLIKDEIDKLSLPNSMEITELLKRMLSLTNVSNIKNLHDWHSYYTNMKSKTRDFEASSDDLYKIKHKEVNHWIKKLSETVDQEYNFLMEIAPWCGQIHKNLIDEMTKHYPKLRPEVEKLCTLLNSLPSYTETPSFLILLNKKIKNLQKKAENNSKHGSPKTLTKTFNVLINSVISGTLTLEKYHARLKGLTVGLNNLAMEMDFSILYNEERKIFTIGKNVTDGKADNSFYDLLASEARLGSFIAIAKGDVPLEHWFHLRRQITVIKNKRVLISWSASMFEYLMPLLIMKSYENTLLCETYDSVVQTQIDYGESKKIPWGVSESAYNAKDIHHQYQYGPFGVPRLGFKYGLGDSTVITPYATVLAALINPKEAVKNMQFLERIGVLTRHGFYESIDYTKTRLPPNKKNVIIQSFMAHHQSMIYTSLNNVIHNNIFQNRFHSAPLVKATSLLLQERVPKNIVHIKGHSQDIKIYSEEGQNNPDERIFENNYTQDSETQILSNGNYTVMITTAGAGFSKCGELAVNRSLLDSTMDNYGQFIYINDCKTKKVWSCAYQPTTYTPDKYKVIFAEHKVEFWREDGGIRTHTEIIVSPEDNVEMRKITITNNTEKTRGFKVTSYLEPVLSRPEDDLAHPLFNKMFIETEYIPEKEALLAKRRTRKKDEIQTWAFHVISVDGKQVAPIQYETKRENFIGRGKSLRNAKCIYEENDLSNSQGVTLDPVFALRTQFKVERFSSIEICFSTGLTHSRDAALNLIDQYHGDHSFKRENELAWTKSQIQLRHLNITHKMSSLYQKLASLLLIPRMNSRPMERELKKNKLPQSSLWKFGISGDLPIFLLRVNKLKDVSTVQELLRAHEYLKLKQIKFDLVLLNDETSSYRIDLHRGILKQIRLLNFENLINQKSGIFIIDSNHITKDELSLLYLVCSVYIDCSKGTLTEQCDSFNFSNKISKKKKYIPKIKNQSKYTSAPLLWPKIEFYNGIGGFINEGKEYFISLTKDIVTPSPWVNVISNSNNFGFVISETGSSYTWAGNSRENRLTPWSNDPVIDPSGEVIYIKDDKSGKVWSPTPWPIRNKEEYQVRHGQGYTNFDHNYNGINSSIKYFTPLNESLKVGILKLHNNTKKKRQLSVTYYVEWVLGFNRNNTSHFINTSKGHQKGVIHATNSYNNEYNNKIAFVAVSGNINSYTCDRKEFLGNNGNYQMPNSFNQKVLLGKIGIGKDPCTAIKTTFEILPNQEKIIYLLLGQEDSKEKIQKIVDSYFSTEYVNKSLGEVINFWDNHCKNIQIKTAYRDIDLMMNRWIPYQVLSCRFWARTGFYQSGGAYGFRDQLQDSLALIYSKPELVKEHIFKSASHQFTDGDVQHWWHPPNNRGVRTHITDDLLWLPYTVGQYIKKTQDYKILDKQIYYLEGEKLSASEEDNYSEASISEVQESLYEHCIKAIEHSLNYAKNDLLLMGGGDWNDGMNTIGSLKQGGSVWLSQFLVVILDEFILLTEKKGDNKNSIFFLKTQSKLRNAIDLNGWDGRWYRRAYFDNGTPVGSIINDECSIDSLVQSWAVFSNSGSIQRQKQVMKEVKEQLILLQEKMILLFTPPFDHSDLNPGYIKAYPPGIRENGGQYTHAAIWVIMAFSKLGYKDYSLELLSLINPIQHTKNETDLNTYKLEPYVLSADVYNSPQHKGRGGWSWYTGSASWYFQAVLDALAFDKVGNLLIINRKDFNTLREYEIKYTYKSSQYKLVFKNKKKLTEGNLQIKLDNKVYTKNTVELLDDNSTHRIDISIE